MKGRALGRPEYQRHQRLHNAMETSTDAGSPEDTLILPPAKQENHISSPSPTQPTTRTRSSTHATHVQSLNTIAEDLATRRASVTAVNYRQLVFLSPPSPYEMVTIPLRLSSKVNTGQYALEFGRVANRVMLDYEIWLVDATSRLNTIVADGRPAVQDFANKLVSAVQDELNHVEMLKQEEWERRSNLLSRARKYWKGGQVPVIDTCTHFFSCVRSSP